MKLGPFLWQNLNEEIHNDYSDESAKKNLLFSIDFKIVSLITVLFILEIESWTVYVQLFTLFIEVFGCTIHIPLVSESLKLIQEPKNFWHRLFPAIGVCIEDKILIVGSFYLDFTCLLSTKIFF